MPDGDNDGLIKILIGIGIGFIAAIILLKKEASTTTQAITQKLEKQEQSPLFSWRPLREIPSIDRLINGLDQYKPIPMYQEEEINSTNSTNSGTESGITHTYKNDEKWIVKRDSNTGRIVGYEIDRKADIK